MPAPLSIVSSGPLRTTALVAAGAIATLGFAPFGAWPLTLVSLLLFLALLARASRPLRDAWLYGTGYFGAGVSWVYVSIHQFGHAPPPLAALLTGLFVAGLALLMLPTGWLLQRWLRQQEQPYPLTTLLFFPALWVLSEWLRTTLLTGFPWLLAGYTPLDSWLAGWAPVTGVLGISYLLATCAAALWLLWQGKPQHRRVAAGVLAAITFSSYGLQQQQWVTPTPNTLPVSLIQGNVDQNIKWLPSEREAIWQRYLQPTLEQAGGQLIVWPETAIPLLLDQAQRWLRPLEQQLLRTNSALITGVASREATADQRWRYHNSISALGAADGIYHKQRLVPFGEYVPLENWLRGLIQFFDLPMSSFSLGPEQQPPLRSHGYALAPFICYEIVYPELVRQSAKHSDFLLTISNDAWFGDSLAPHQHLQMARMRALENGRQLLRGTNNGISALIDQRGHILAQSPQFVTTVLSGELQQMRGTTPFTRFGSSPLLLGCTATLLYLFYLMWRRSRKA
ncbi:MAG TPA: apolipoprotein N-acyltransferase [Motiliproteus sp.]